MKRLPDFLRQFSIGLLTIILITSAPASVFAETAGSNTTPAAATTTSSETSPSPATASGSGATNVPTGADAAAYIYNTTSGVWENAYYTWDSSRGAAVPKTAPEYTYNPQTNLWDTMLWQYQTATGSYALVPLSVATPPAGAVTHGGPNTVSTPGVSGQPAATQNVQNPDRPGQNAQQNQPSGLNASPTLQTANSAGAGAGQITTVNLNTAVTSSAQSGNALVVDNHKAGNASSGNAQASATVLNMLQSTSALADSGLVTFTRNLGEVQGDFVLDLTSLLQPTSIQAGSQSPLAVNSQFQGSIQNDIDLSAVSGSATISGNDKAGDATTGNAAAVANVVNMINSVIAANQSFLGVINIYGDFTGNILVPSDALNALLAGNGQVADDIAAADMTTTADTTANLASRQQISNNVDLSAVSGNATVQNNKRAGDATTGNAMTKLTILNVTGHQVTAANSLLVFVNVMGSWVGVIMDAPAGTTSAALTGGAYTSASADDTADVPGAHEESTTMADDLHITNNITAHARSGDATVADNKRAGDATTGTASASANIVNIINSHFSLSQWFGVLFINVFGNWHGNFGTTKSIAASGTGQTANVSEPVKVFRFVPTGGNTVAPGLSAVRRGGQGADVIYDQVTAAATTAVLADKDVVNTIRQHTATTAPQVHHQAGFSLAALPIFLGLTGLTAVGAERVRSIRRRLAYRLLR